MNSGLLKNKNILLGVTGSIAIYKTLELIRLYIKSGANVKVIMTNSAKRFITALSFETISQSRVLDEENECWDKESVYNHIAIGKWADIFVIAPASANTINKLSHGIADNLLTQTALAYPKTKLLCPAANTNMLNNPLTKDSLKMLGLCNYKIVEPVSKELACRDIGEGAMSEIDDIFYATAKELLKEEYWENRKVVLSGGGTIEKIDDIRYLSNFSSGKMASSLALALYLKGAEVCLLSSKGYEILPKQINIIGVQSTKDMFENMKTLFKSVKADPTSVQKTPYLFMVAAISDYVPIQVQKGKLKKEQLGSSWSLELKENMDILHSLDKKGVISIGFKAEIDEINASNNAKNMIAKKNIDGVCLNILSQNNPFGSNTNDIELFLKNTNDTVSFKGDKLTISFQLLTKLQEVFSEQ